MFAVNRIVGSIVEKDMERGSDENVEVKQEKREEEEGEMEVDEGAQDEAKMEKEEKEEKPEGEASATEAMEENEKPAEKQEISLQQVSSFFLPFSFIFSYLFITEGIINQCSEKESNTPHP